MEAEDIEKVQFEWINAAAKPSPNEVLLQNVVIVSLYLNDPFRTLFTKKYCSKGEIQSREQTELETDESGSVQYGFSDSKLILQALPAF